MESNEFRVPRENTFYHLDEDFQGYTRGSTVTISYPSGRRYGGTFGLWATKKNNKDTPATKFGCEHFNMLRLNQLKLTPLKTVYNNLTEEQLAQSKGK